MKKLLEALSGGSVHILAYWIGIGGRTGYAMLSVVEAIVLFISAALS